MHLSVNSENMLHISWSDQNVAIVMLSMIAIGNS